VEYSGRLKARLFFLNNFCLCLELGVANLGIRKGYMLNIGLKATKVDNRTPIIMVISLEGKHLKEIIAGNLKTVHSIYDNSDKR